MSSTSDKISGKAKQEVGKTSNNKELEFKGVLEEARGNVKSKLKRSGDKVADVIEDIKRP